MGNFDVRIGKGFGYERDGFRCMIKCFDCGQENLAAAVTSGGCAWCGFNANGEAKKREHAARAGGRAISKDRQHMSAIGKLGGSRHSREHMQALAERSRAIRAKRKAAKTDS
jgi:general stress protein YciG